MSKLTNFNKDYKATSQSIRSAVSQATLQLNTAIKQQGYIRKNPDGNISEADIVSMQDTFIQILSDFKGLIPLVDDMEAVHTGALTVDALIEKYNVDVDQYSAELEDAPVDWS